MRKPALTIVCPDGAVAEAWQIGNDMQRRGDNWELWLNNHGDEFCIGTTNNKGLFNWIKHELVLIA
jgi:hypothetical protein